MDVMNFSRMFPLAINCAPYSNSSIEATLEFQGLWNQFEKLGTEMIITKPGRRMFPTLKFKLKGLDAQTDYAILLDMYPASEHRYKYQHLQWTASGKAEPSPSPRVYCHPDSPSPGSYWMEQPVDFYKLKLTNNFMDRTAGHIVLNSMHKYTPCLHILAAPSPMCTKLKGIDQQRTWVLAATIKFTQATFMAVTAYQNEDVTRLKILYNPFAKGFREGEQMRRDNKVSRTIKRGSSCSSETDSLKPIKVSKVDEDKKKGADAMIIENESKSIENSPEKKNMSAIPDPAARHLGFCMCPDCVTRSSNLGALPHPNSFFIPSFYPDIYRHYSAYGPPPSPFFYYNHPNMMPSYPASYYPLSRYTQPPSSLHDYDGRLL